MASIHINGSISNATINIKDGKISINGFAINEQKYRDILLTIDAKNEHDESLTYVPFSIKYAFAEMMLQTSRSDETLFALKATEATDEQWNHRLDRVSAIVAYCESKKNLFWSWFDAYIAMIGILSTPR